MTDTSAQFSVRASATGRILSCGASAWPEGLEFEAGLAPDEEFEVDDSSEYSVMGTAGHEVDRAIVERHLRGVPDELLDEVVLRYGFDADKAAELKRLAWGWVTIWNVLRDIITPMFVESEMRTWIGFSPEDAKLAGYAGFWLTGHPDLSGLVSPEMGAVVDAKSGFVERDFRDQFMAYSLLMRDWLVRHGRPAPKVWKQIVAWTRFSQYEALPLVEDAELTAWSERLAATVARKRHVYAPGDACQYCPRRVGCPAKQQAVRDTALTLVESQLPSTSRELAALYPRIRLIERAVDEYKKLVKQAILSEGAQELPDGSLLAIQKQDRMELDAIKTLEAYANRNGIGMGAAVRDLAGCLTVSKTRVMDLIRASVSRGHKQKEQERFTQELELAGAVRFNQTVSLQVRKKGVDLDGE